MGSESESALTPVHSSQSWLESARFEAMEHGEWPDVPLIAVDVASEFDPSSVAVPGHQAVDSTFHVADLIAAALG